MPDWSNMAPAQGQSDLLLGVIGVIIFLAVFIYTAFKAFVEISASPYDHPEAEQKTRIAGFVVGVLLTVLVIVADLSPSPVTPSGLLALFPWYLFTCLGIFLGLSVAIISVLLGHSRPTSGAGLVILVLAFCSSTGLYWSVFASGWRSQVLSILVSILIGLFSFRLLFPGQKADEQATS